MTISNRDRADFAASAISDHETTTGSRGEDPSTLLTDLLANLQHWAKFEGVDFNAALKNARGHFKEERAEALADAGYKGKYC